MGFFIFDLLKSVMLAIAELFGLSRIEDTSANGLKIFVKMISHQGTGSRATTNVSINVQPEWSIRKVKETIAEKLNVNSEDLKIIFAGHELRNDIQVKVSHVH